MVLVSSSSPLLPPPAPLPFSPQTGSPAALFRALKIPRSSRTRLQQAHHAQPADEGQRTHQGGSAPLPQVFLIKSVLEVGRQECSPGWANILTVTGG